MGQGKADPCREQAGEWLSSVAQKTRNQTLIYAGASRKKSTHFKKAKDCKRKVVCLQGFSGCTHKNSNKVTCFFIFVTACEPGSQANPHSPGGTSQYLFP